MKKLFITLLIFCPTLLWAGSGSFTTQISGTAGAAGGSATIGNETAGETEGTVDDNYMRCIKLSETPANNGTVQTVMVTAATSNGTKKMMISIYNDDGGTGCYDNHSCPSTVVANSSVEVTPTSSKADVEYTYTGTKPVVVADAIYWVCQSAPATAGSNQIYYTVTAGGFMANKAITYNTFPDWEGSAAASRDDYNYGKAYFTYSW